MNLPLRILLILVVVGAAIAAAMKFTPHHTTDNPFTTLYMHVVPCLLYTSPSPRDRQKSRMPSSA